MSSLHTKSICPKQQNIGMILWATVAACNEWPLNNFDFDQAFLNSKLVYDEVIYLEQPPGYETRDREHWVWRLLRALYGLKQGAKNWHDNLCRALNELGFTRSEADHGIFFKRIRKDIIILAVHASGKREIA